MEKDITLTYEMLYELARKEKTNPELQALPKDFLAQLKSYIDEKSLALERAKSDREFGQAELLEGQLRSAKRVARALLDKRISKVIELALTKIKVPTAAVDTSALLEHELQFYNELVEKLKACFEKWSFVSRSEPEIKRKEAAERKPAGLQVRFIAKVDQFYGEELEEYGPFEPGESAWLPPKLAQLLIDQGKAEPV